MMTDAMLMRASDRDRQEVVDRLRAGLEDGRLDLDEYMTRMERAYQALTYADLAPLYADLPAADRGAGPAAGQGPEPRQPQAAALAGCGFAGLPTVLKVLWTIWLTAVSINVVVWALVSATSAQLAYPWPLWVAGPYGALLFAVSAAVTRCRRGLR